MTDLSFYLENNFQTPEKALAKAVFDDIWPKPFVNLIPSSPTTPQSDAYITLPHLNDPVDLSVKTTPTEDLSLRSSSEASIADTAVGPITLLGKFLEGFNELNKYKYALSYLIFIDPRS